MAKESINTNDLVEQTLSVLPHMSKKLFGPVHVLHESDLHHTHFLILHMIEDAQSIRTTDIAKKMEIRKSNLTPLLNKLFEKKYITRLPDSHDKRVKYIELTSEGREFLNQKKNVIQADVEEKLATLDKAEQEKLFEAVSNLHEVIGKLNE